MERFSFDAVIFDLDGVITKTALVHAAAWKAAFDGYLRSREELHGEPFRAFTHEKDYLPYVDGKPRYEGVRSFLESRGINIPFGAPDDTPDRETVCGIGNRKNAKFIEILEDRGVEVYPSTIGFVKELKEKNIRVGVASSSKNCKYVLKSAGIEDLFETRVDGEVSARVGLKGKPEGDIFVAAASNLGARPAKAVVVEDAVSGVQAGRNGAFGLVLGVARENNNDELLQNGADAAVPDLEYIDLDWIEEWFHKKPRPLLDLRDAESGGPDVPFAGGTEKRKVTVNPCYFRGAKEVLSGGRKPVFFLDYDGTLTPIRDRPDLAVMSDETRDALRRVAEKHAVAIVSGRDRKEVEDLVAVRGIFYAGNHGFDIKGPGVSMVHPEAEAAMPLIAKAGQKLSERLGAVPGSLIEEKGFSVSVHYRLVEDRYVPEVEDAVTEAVRDNAKLRLMRGKKVFEILPAVNWDKGKAVRWIMDVLGLSWETVSVIYIGDDVTDENAFRMIRTRGTGVSVSGKIRESAADFRISSPEEVKRLFMTMG